MDQQYGTPTCRRRYKVQHRNDTVMCCSLGKVTDYRYNSSVTSMLADLQWPSLQHRRYVTRLKLFYNSVYSSSVLTVPNYFINTTYPTHHHHPFHFEIPFARTDHYKFSYYPNSIRNWNNLPIDSVESQSLRVFLDKL